MSDDDDWNRAVELAGSLLSAAGALQRESTQSEARLRAALEAATGRRAALVLVSVLPTSFTVALARPVVACGLSQRDANLVRQIFGRLPRHEQVSVVPVAVWHQLAETPDVDAYQRMAELLYYLGLDDALAQLVEAAAASDDPEVRAVADDFGDDD